MANNGVINQNGTVYKKSIIKEIIDIAIKESDGVYDIYSGNGKTKSKNNKGVKIAFLGNNVSVDVFLVAKYGCSVPEMASNIQENVKCRIETITDFKVKTVNINILDVEF